MTQVLILLAALHGYHGTKDQCKDVSESLADFATYIAVYSQDHKNPRKNYNIDDDLRAIKKFNKECQKGKK
jgi:hypothetical protein